MGGWNFITVVHEDRDVIVVEKPAGAVIQAGERHVSSTYVDSLRSYLMRKHKSRGAYVKPVHRLDRETSGLMVFAKSKAGEKLIDQFRDHTIKRSYLAVVEGQVEEGSGEIRLPIAKGDFGFGRKASIARGGEGREARTLFTVKERYANATLLKLDLKTGRTHQARVHLAAVGHPIVGDRLYGKSGGIPFARQALHSHQISFKHPATGHLCRYSSDLPADMRTLIDQLRGS